MLDFQPVTIIFTIINLLVLYFFFRKFLFGRVNAVLAQREQLIQQQIAEAEAANARAQQAQAEYEQKLATARQEAAQLMADAKQRADAAYADRLAEADADARQRAEDAARGGVAQLAVLAAAEIAAKRLDTDDDRALAEEFLQKVGNAQ